MTTIAAHSLPTPPAPSPQTALASGPAAPAPDARTLPFWRRLSSAVTETHRASVPF